MCWAVVTGAAGGIGGATVKRLVRRGFRVLALDRSVPSSGGDDAVDWYEADVATEDSLARAAHHVEASGAGLAALVTCAGLFAQTPALRSDARLVRQLVDVNLTAAVLAAQHFAPLMARRRAGRIVHVASIAAVRGAALAGAYAAAKAGVVALTQSHARELASAGISVNAVLPGYVDTSMLEPSRPMVERFVVPRIPLRRIGAPDEIAEVIEFLVTARTPYLTGAAIPVDGGLHVG